MSRNGNLNNLQNGTETPCSCPSICNWDVPLLTDVQEKLPHKYAALVLNRPITQSEKFLNTFWNNALVRISVDGGTRQWDLFLNKLSTDAQQNMKLPDLITGDFDSITEEILEKYKKKGCKDQPTNETEQPQETWSVGRQKKWSLSYNTARRANRFTIEDAYFFVVRQHMFLGESCSVSWIVHTPDQQYTDFTKALMELQKYCQLNNIEIDHVMVLGQSSGRLDQILGNIQTLFLVKEKRLLEPKIKVYLITDDAVSWLLRPGQHVIKVPKETRLHKRAWCSLVPVGEACEKLTTAGLKWNLDGQSLRFGDLVSTSNTFDGSESVAVECSHTLLWSMRIPSVFSL